MKGIPVAGRCEAYIRKALCREKKTSGIRYNSGTHWEGKRDYNGTFLYLKWKCLGEDLRGICLK